MKGITMSNQEYRRGGPVSRIEIYDYMTSSVRRPGRDYDWPLGKPTNIGQERVLAEGVVREDGEVLTGKKRQRIVDRLLGKYDNLPEVFDPSLPEWAVRPYIPGLMNFGTVPALVGPKGWGKTKFLCSLGVALVIPGHRLLGYFDPVELAEEERSRDVWLLNAETHPGVLHEELLATGLAFGYRDGVPCYFYDPEGTGEPLPRHGVLIVEQLTMTSATKFDLTDEAGYEAWAIRLTEFINRVPPLMVIADGVTAMLGNSTTRYGVWTSKFKDLLRECGIPNGLGVLHSPMGVNTNTPMNGIESMGQWDGMWIASSPQFPIRPTDKRYFETLPRLGDSRVPTREVVIDEEGLLQLLIDSKPPKKVKEGGEARKEVLFKRLCESPEPLWTNEVVGTGDDYQANKKALEELASEGLVVEEKVQRGRTRGVVWRAADEGDGDGH